MNSNSFLLKKKKYPDIKRLIQINPIDIKIHCVHVSTTIVAINPTEKRLRRIIDNSFYKQNILRVARNWGRVVFGCTEGE